MFSWLLTLWLVQVDCFLFIYLCVYSFIFAEGRRLKDTSIVWHWFDILCSLIDSYYGFMANGKKYSLVFFPRPENYLRRIWVIFLFFILWFMDWPVFLIPQNWKHRWRRKKKVVKNSKENTTSWRKTTSCRRLRWGSAFDEMNIHETKWCCGTWLTACR